MKLTVKPIHEGVKFLNNRNINKIASVKFQFQPLLFDVYVIVLIVECFDSVYCVSFLPSMLHISVMCVCVLMLHFFSRKSILHV